MILCSQVSVPIWISLLLLICMNFECHIRLLLLLMNHLYWTAYNLVMHFLLVLIISPVNFVSGYFMCQPLRKQLMMTSESLRLQYTCKWALSVRLSYLWPDLEVGLMLSVLACCLWGLSWLLSWWAHCLFISLWIPCDWWRGNLMFSLLLWSGCYFDCSLC